MKFQTIGATSMKPWTETLPLTPGQLGPAGGGGHPSETDEAKKKEKSKLDYNYFLEGERKGVSLLFQPFGKGKSLLRPPIFLDLKFVFLSPNCLPKTFGNQTLNTQLLK